MAAKNAINKFSPMFIGAIVVIQCLSVAASASCIGCLELDELTFDKILKKFSTVLVKFDIAYPYGDKHEAYAKLAAEIPPVNGDFVVTVVGIKDYGNKENSKLAERFGVADKYPVIKLFRNGNADEWIDYPNGETLQLLSISRISELNGNVSMGFFVDRSECDGGQSSAVCATTFKHLYGTQWMRAAVRRAGKRICACGP